MGTSLPSPRGSASSPTATAGFSAWLDLLYGVGLARSERAWTWELAAIGEVAHRRRPLHRFAGFGDWRP